MTTGTPDPTATLTDPENAGPLFFIAALPWRKQTNGESPPQPVEFKHTSSTLADYATTDQLGDHVYIGYTSLLVGQRVGLVRAGTVIATWPEDSTGPSESLGQPQDAAWAVRVGDQPDPGSRSRCFTLATGTLPEVREAAVERSMTTSDVVIVVRQCLYNS